jgi:hypothetical protein
MSGTMKMDRKTGEPILIEFLRTPISGSVQMGILFETFPWRSLALGLLLLYSLMGLFGPEGGLVGLPVLCALVLVEMWNRRDFATPLRIVRQSGILGRTRVEIPLEEVERVEFKVYSQFPEKQLDIGEVTILGNRRLFIYTGIRTPEATAQHILDLKNRNEIRKEIAAGEQTGEASPLLGSVVKETDLLTPIQERWEEDR